MKKKIWLSAVLCLLLAFSVGAFAACNNNNDDPLKARGNTNAITDGVFELAVPEARFDFLLKFYENGTWYGQDLMGGRHEGKYEVVDMNLEYIASGSDGIVHFKEDAGGNRMHDADGKALLKDPDELDSPDLMYEVGRKATKAVKFFESDGTTPFTITDTDNYFELTDRNIVAWDDNTIWNAGLGGYTRTMKQNPTKTFTVQDEIATPIATYMVEELPAWAQEGDYEGLITVQDCTIIFNNNGTYANSLFATRELGTYTEAGGVYTLTKTGGTAAGTVTVTSSSITYVNGANTITLVEFAEAAEVVYTFTGEGIGMMGNTPLAQADTSITLECMSDGTFRALDKNDGVLGSGKWSKSETTGLIEFTDVVSGEDKSDFTITGIVKNGTTLEFTVSVKASGGMVTITADDMSGEFVSVSHTFAGTATGTQAGDIALELRLYDDDTCSLVEKKTGNELELDKGTWTLNGNVIVVTFENKGVVNMVLAKPPTITWSGTFNGMAISDTVLSKV